MDTSPWLRQSVTENDFPRSICGRVFSRDDLELIRHLIRDNPSANRSQISRLVCQAFSWYKPDGGLKEMSCRVVLLRLHRGGLIELPAPRHPNINGQRRVRRHFPEAEPQDPLTTSIQELLPLALVRVTAGTEPSYLWNELIDRYHYLGYSPLPGAQLRYLVHSQVGYLGAIGFSAAAWSVASRDEWIGWTSTLRKQNLHLVVNNSRFLILPWIRCKNLASKILSLSAARLLRDWQESYCYKPVLLETFVEARFKGTCYKAANWRLVGCTLGLGKLGAPRKRLPLKDIYLYPLDKNYRAILRGKPPQKHPHQEVT